MSNLIPPLLSSSPPPIVGPLDEDEDDEFGDFRAAADSYNYDDFSLPSSPQKSPEKELKTDLSKANLDINCNKSQKVSKASEMPKQNVNGSLINEEVGKDFQDRRKSADDSKPETEVNCSNSRSVASPEVFNNHTDKNFSHAECSQTLKEQILDKEIKEPNPECSGDQSTKIQNFSNTLEEDSSDYQCAVSSCESNHETSTETIENEIGNGQCNLGSPNNEENLFDSFSESIQEKTSSADLSELNETNEIKSENDVDEINDDTSEKDTEKDDKLDDSLKEINYDLSESSVSLRVCETDPKLSDNEFGDFANFDSEIVDQPQADSEDEFDEFVNPHLSSTQSVQEQDDDDFGDFESSEFADFCSNVCEKPDFLDINEKNAVEKTEIILKGIFPMIDGDINEFEFMDGTKGNKIFNELKDVTETNALIYQWSKSNSQKMFFKALNIDTRNILYGPAWNCSMPRFAANLGLAPLEPMKSEILTPTPFQNVSSPSISSQKSNGDIPTAQFDWSGSGLINPLDYSQTMLLDLEQLVASLDIPSTTNPTFHQSPSPSNELLDEWDLWLQSTSTELPGNVPEDSSQPQTQTDFLPPLSVKPEPVPSLFDTGILEKIAATPENENIQLPKSDNLSFFESPKLIPLRETHIATELNDFNSKPGWLQPTIVTPDLPRKETAMDPEEDDEFDDFQMVLPEDKIEANGDVRGVKSGVLAPMDLAEFGLIRQVSSLDKTSHNHEHIFGVSSSPIESPKVQKQTNDVNDEEEFTEFHSSVPQVEILKPLQPTPLVPLKPTLQYSIVAQINWPNPGVTEEDIKNIELVYSRKDESVKENVESRDKDASKSNSVDDDEWTDFVSVTNPVKSLPERTATPDLPLSVLNLNNVHAPKQPIPVITPSGLVQTKLSSNITLQPKSVVQTTVQPMFTPPTNQFQPSIISNQFAANFFPSTSLTQCKSQSQDDDDDWSDFVSSQPPPQVNGYQQKASFVQGKAPPINWTNATTNIIMNPTHFDTFQNFAPSQNKKVSAMPARNAVPSISAIPDLDFIAPKNRTSKK